MAAASFAREILVPISAALAIGGLEVPDDVPGVDEGVEGAAMAGWPSPGVRLVEQPNTVREVMSAAAATPRKPPVSCSVFLRMRASCCNRKSVGY
jgi:hypothetical protein